MQHIAVRPDGSILVADVRGGFLRLLGRDGTLLGRIGEGVLRKPQGVSLFPDGRIIVADSGLHKLVVLSPQGQLIGTIGRRGRRPGQFNSPRAVAVSRDGRIAVADTKNHRIQVLSESGRVLLCVGRRGAQPGQFQIPEGIRWDDEGRIFVADTVNHRIQVLNASGKVLKIIGRYGIDPGCLYFPEDVVVDSQGRVYVSDTFNQRISIFKPDGSLLALAYEYGDGIPLQYPYGIDLGEQDMLWVLDMPSGEVGPVAWEPAPPEVLAAARQAQLRPTKPPMRDRLANYLTASSLTPSLILTALAVAVVLGALHALEPGHGKTLVAAYLVGTHGTPLHAVLLGLVVTASHVASVVVLGLVALAASEYVLPQRLGPYFGVVSGIIIAAMGVVLFRRALRGYEHHHHHHHGLHNHHHGHEAEEHHHHGPADHAHEHPHEHGHEHVHEHEHHDGNHAHDHGHDHEDEHHHAPEHGHEHEHQHDEEHGHEHSHGPAASAQAGAGVRSHEAASDSGARQQSVSLWSLLVLGISGGIVPCPAAIVVLLTAISVGRIALGLALIAAFSLGLALTLIAIGLAVTLGMSAVPETARESQLIKALPYASAVVITLLGIGLTAASLRAIARL